MQMTAGIRPFRPGIAGETAGDAAALSDICARTAANGQDARGVLSDDRLWGDVFAMPYAVRHPDLAFVVVTDADEPIGYVLGTDDAVAFDRWFRDEWWPSRRPAEVAADGPEAMLVRYADVRGDAGAADAGDEGAADAGGAGAGAADAGALAWARTYPAELHIDLLPAAQGAGWGRRLMQTFLDALREAGVPGVHLGVSTANPGAIAFYRRLGFTPLEEAPDTVVFGMLL